MGKSYNVPIDFLADMLGVSLGKIDLFLYNNNIKFQSIRKKKFLSKSGAKKVQEAFKNES